MYITARTLDDLLRKVYELLLKSTNHFEASKGPLTEIPGVLLKIRNPRTRLSRTEKRGRLFSCLGELIWYLAGTNKLEFIRYYIPEYSESSDDGDTIYGGYGPRLFGKGENNQVFNVIQLLKAKRTSRQAVIQLFSGADLLKPRKDIPCTCTMQFMVRNDRLHMFTTMRSNDAYLGLPHDVFTFTMLQEIIARSLGVELGEYKHAVGSLHLYDKDIKAATQYLSEDWQSEVPMPAMPIGDPWPSIKMLLKAEENIRNGKEVGLNSLSLDSYWRDLVRILQIYNYTADPQKMPKVAPLRKQMTSDVYHQYLLKRHSSRLKLMQVPEQLKMFQESAPK
ncbi:MAG: thymidylate synthase family protein [Herminiimonas sp.]|nr:thymidylate synthase family protein [Herminiimonas sp.]